MMKYEVEFIPDFALDDPEVRSISDMVAKALQEEPDTEWEKTKKEQRCVIIDIDGTLADVRGAVQQKKDGEFDWENFFGAIPYVPCNDWAVRLTQIYYQMGYVVCIVTGRPDRYQKQTEGWLAKYGVPYDFLYMRKDGDKRKDDIVKKEILEKEFKKELVEFVLDDRPSVVQMWRDEGLTCLACNPHLFI